MMDMLIPGDPPRWPSASAVIPGVETFVLELGDDAPYALALASDIADKPPAERERALGAREAADGPAFGRMLAALYRAYYTSPAVLAAVAGLVDGGPREAGPHFDPALLQQVSTRRPGQRRL